jgi:LemA protein
VLFVVYNTEINQRTIMATKSKQRSLTSSLTLQKVGAWSLVVLALLYFTGTTINDAQAPDVPPSPLDIIWPVVLFAVLPLFWLKRINESQNQKRYLSATKVIAGFTILALVMTTWGFYRDAQKYFVYQDELISQKFAAVNIVYEKRFSLVPNVAKSANALARQERSVVSDITKARAAYLRSQGLDGKVGAINDFNKALTNISINTENYPDLKSDKGFLGLISVIEKTESALADAKNDYNQQITTLNTQSRTFPYNFLASGFIDDPVKARIDSSVSSQALDAKHLLDNLN